MTDDVQPQAGTTVAFTFTQSIPTTWLGTATCVHGVTRNTTYLIAPGVPPLNHTFMVDNVYRQHFQLLPTCNCTPVRPGTVATITFLTPVTAVPPGQQRYIPQQSANLTGPDLWWGPGLTCAKTGGYGLTAQVQLAASIASGARGNGVLLIAGQPTTSVPMTDQGGFATANLSVSLNLIVNQSIALGYENTGTTNQNVQAASLTVTELWVP